MYRVEIPGIGTSGSRALTISGGAATTRVIQAGERDAEAVVSYYR